MVCVGAIIVFAGLIALHSLNPSKESEAHITVLTYNILLFAVLALFLVIQMRQEEKKPKLKTKVGNLTEEQFAESCRLETQLDKMQYDSELTSFQRKMANDAIKAIMLFEEYPMVYGEFYRRVIREIKEAKKYSLVSAIEEAKGTPQ